MMQKGREIGGVKKGKKTDKNKGKKEVKKGKKRSKNKRKIK